MRIVVPVNAAHRQAEKNLARPSRRAGVRMDETRHLFHGFGKGTPAFLRWQVLVQRKITEMDDLIGRAKKMKLLLQRADRCKCLDLEECGKAVLARSVKKR